MNNDWKILNGEDDFKVSRVGSRTTNEDGTENTIVLEYNAEKLIQYVKDVENVGNAMYSMMNNFEHQVCEELGLASEITGLHEILTVIKNIMQQKLMYEGIRQELIVEDKSGIFNSKEGKEL